jgi:hypothetical protein
MSKKSGSAFFGVKAIKADGATFLFEFPTLSALKKAKAGAKRIGLNLSDVICAFNPVFQPFMGLPKAPPVRRKFTHQDRARKPRTVEIQITKCDPFTRLCFERQVRDCGYETIEDYIIDSAFCALASNEEEAVLDPQTGEVVLTLSDLGDFLGCEVRPSRVLNEKHCSFRRVPTPAGTIVETYA